jgi:hypothetical protein
MSRLFFISMLVAINVLGGNISKRRFRWCIENPSGVTLYGRNCIAERLANLDVRYPAYIKMVAMRKRQAAEESQR